MQIEIGQHSSTGSHLWSDGQPRINLSRAVVTESPAHPHKDEPLTIALVADTVAGYAYRKHWPESYPPAQHVIDTIIQTFETTPHTNIVQCLEASFQAIQTHLRSMTEAYAICAIAVVCDQRLYMGLHGDCRVFLLRGGDVIRISITLTMAEKLIEGGYVTLHDLMTNPYDGRGPLRFFGNTWETEWGDVRLRLSPADSDEVARSQQGLLLQPDDQIVIVSSHIFGDFIRPDEEMRFRTIFFDPNLSAQAKTDQFIARIRERNTYSDLSMIAMRMV